MTDAALAVGASPLAALLATPGASSPSPSAPQTGQDADAFAALLAGASAPTQTVPTANIGQASPVAALLATTAATPVPKTMPAPVMSIVRRLLPHVGVTAMQPAVGAMPTADELGPKSTNSDLEDDQPGQELGDDPLADAIASGATAVLALAPTIIAPLPVPPSITPDAQVSAMVTDASRTLGAVTTISPALPDTPRAQLAQGDGRQDQPGTLNKQIAPRPTAPVALPEAIVAAVFAQLKSDEGADATTAAAPADAGTAPQTSEAAAPAPAAPALPSIAAEQPALVKAQAPAIPNAPALAAAGRTSKPRGDDDASMSKGASDTSKQVESAAADPLPPPLPQGVAPVHAASGDRAAPVIGPKGDAVIQQTLSIARDGAWLDRLARDIAGSAGTGGELHFKLNPQNLGALSVSVSQGIDGASVRMTADNDTARNILLDAQPSLIAEARAHGLTISNTQVDVNRDQNPRQNQPQGEQQNHGSNSGTGQDPSRWAQGNAGQSGAQQNGQNRQSSPSHQPFVSNLGRKAGGESESASGDSDALYA